MTETNKMLEECANYLLNHCFVLGGVEDQRAKYLYVQDHLNEVRAVFAPLGYSVVLYPAPLQAAALVNEHEGSQARLLKYESILLLVLRLLSAAASARSASGRASSTVGKTSIRLSRPVSRPTGRARLYRRRVRSSFSSVGWSRRRGRFIFWSSACTSSTVTRTWSALAERLSRFWR